MKTAIVAYPSIGENREIKFLVERYKRKEITSFELEKESMKVYANQLDYQKESGVTYISINDFSYYDKVLDTAILFNIIPKKYLEKYEDKYELYFALADELAMKKWFNTNYHYIVPKYDASVELKLNMTKIKKELSLANELGIKAKVNILGIFTLLDCMGEKYIPGLIDKYIELIEELKKLNVSLIQIEEPIFVCKKIENIAQVYSKILKNKDKAKVLLQTYFSDICPNIEQIKNMNIDALGLDFVNGEQNYFFLNELNKFQIHMGLIDSQTVFKTNKNEVYSKIKYIQKYCERVVLSTTASLKYIPYSIKNEKNEKFKNLAFAKEKVKELVEISKMQGLGSNFEPKKEKLKNTKINFKMKKKKEQKNLIFSTVGSFPQSQELRDIRREYKKGNISRIKYEEYIKEEIKSCIKLQEAVGLDILVHGEFERADMVEYFANNLNGFLIGENSWVQSYGTRCTKPPIIFDKISRKGSILKKWLKYTKSLTTKEIKAILTGPNTILAWSYYEPKYEKKLKEELASILNIEIKEAENLGIKYIQIDEPALLEKLPLKDQNKKEYVKIAVKAFRNTIKCIRKRTVILSHICYSKIDFSILNLLNVDIFLIEAKKSQQIFDKKLNFTLGLGVYDVHSQRIPSVIEIEKEILKYVGKNIWINPDCGLKTRKKEQVFQALLNIRKAIDKIEKENKKK